MHHSDKPAPATAAVRPEQRKASKSLNQREIQILSLIADGKTDIEIGDILRLHAGTVNFHVQNVKRKLSVSTRIQAVVTAMREGSIR